MTEKVKIKGDTNTLMLLWLASLKRPKESREGQAIMNKLADLDFDMYKIIRGGKYDCFYDDAIIPDLIMYLNSVYNM